MGRSIRIEARFRIPRGMGSRMKRGTNGMGWDGSEILYDGVLPYKPSWKKINYIKTQFEIVMQRPFRAYSNMNLEIDDVEHRHFRETKWKPIIVFKSERIIAGDKIQGINNFPRRNRTQRFSPAFHFCVELCVKPGRSVHWLFHSDPSFHHSIHVDFGRCNVWSAIIVRRVNKWQRKTIRLAELKYEYLNHH